MKSMLSKKFLGEDTLEEGREALFKLEKQLKLRKNFDEPEKNESVKTNAIFFPQKKVEINKIISENESSEFTNATTNLSPTNPPTVITTPLVPLNANINNGKYQQVTNSRKMLDQIPRVTRLTQRLESLGLTVEELDDRGLIEGGAGSLPGSQYSSVRSRSRRSLELQSRSHRLQERGKEALSKVRNGLFHMLRVLSRKGFDLERYCKRFCTTNSSTHNSDGNDKIKNMLMTKKNFFSMLKTFGLPLSTRELQDITQYYVILAPGSDGERIGVNGPDSSSSAATNVLSFNFHGSDLSHAVAEPSDARSRFSDKGGSSSNSNNNNAVAGEHADFVGLLRDARLLASAAARRGSLPEEDEDVDIDLDMDADLDDVEDVRSYTQVLCNLKSMLLESTKSLGKHQDDVYRMFARWDTQGMGTVTATQFLRVLARLHVELSDQDQDFLVELLDTNAMGRIDFESLLNYCFSPSHSTPHSDSLDYMLSSPVSTLKHGSGGARAPEDFTGETVSAVSTGTKDFSGEHSVGRAHRNLQRPHTASSTLSRPYAEQSHFLEQPPYGMQLQTHSLQLPTTGSLTLSDDPSQQQQKIAFRRMNSEGNYPSTSLSGVQAADAVGGGSAAVNLRNQRPQTASGRVNSSSSSEGAQRQRQSRDDGTPSGSKDAKKLGGIASYGHLDSIYDDIEVYDGDDALLDENLALPNSYSSERKTDGGFALQPADQDSWSEQQRHQLVAATQQGQARGAHNAEELATSLSADQHEYDFGSINDIPDMNVGRGSGWASHNHHERLDFRKGLDYGSERGWSGSRTAG